MIRVRTRGLGNRQFFENWIELLTGRRAHYFSPSESLFRMIAKITRVTMTRDEFGLVGDQWAEYF